LSSKNNANLIVIISDDDFWIFLLELGVDNANLTK
jgi:hypothetical protein